MKNIFDRKDATNTQAHSIRLWKENEKKIGIIRKLKE